MNRIRGVLNGGNGDLVPPSKSVRFKFSRGFSGTTGAAVVEITNYGARMPQTRLGGCDYQLRTPPPCAEPPRKKEKSSSPPPRQILEYVPEQNLPGFSFNRGQMICTFKHGEPCFIIS